MKIAESLKKDCILPDLEARNKVDCLMEFAACADRHLPGTPKDEIAHLLLEREKLGSTGIQDGVAIPHAKIKSLDRLVLLFGRSLAGIDFQSFDNKPTHLFFVLLVPEETTREHLKMLARLSRMLKKAPLREKLLQAKNAQEIYTILCEEDKLL